MSLMMGLCNQNVVSLLHDAMSFEAQLVVVASTSDRRRL